jgi:hypothetical protein
LEAAWRFSVGLLDIIDDAETNATNSYMGALVGLQYCFSKKRYQAAISTASFSVIQKFQQATTLLRRI